MKRLIILIFGLVASVSWGKPASNLGADMDMLKFEEFVKLSAADREDYLETIRQFVLKSERAQKVSLDDEAARASLWAILSIGQAMAAVGDDCIYAGYISTLGANGRCSPPAARSWNYNGQSRSFCSGGGTLCNPLIYGFGADGNGICTTHRTAPTNDCDDKYRKIPNYGGAEIAKQLSDAGLKDEFDKQNEKVKKYCNSSASSSQKELCKYTAYRNGYLRKKLQEAEKAKPPKKEAEKPKPTGGAEGAKPDAAKPETAKPETAKPDGNAPMPLPPLPGQQKPSDSPQAPGPSAPAAPASAPPASSPPANKPADKPAAKPAEAKKPEAPKDGCIRSKADFEALRDKFPPELRNIDKGNAPVCVVMPPQRSLGMDWDVPGAVEIQMEGDRLRVGTYISPPSISGRKIIKKDSYAKEICLKPPGLHLKFTDATEKDVELKSNGINFFDEQKPQDPPTLFKYDDSSKCAKIKQQVNTDAAGSPGRVEKGNK